MKTPQELLQQALEVGECLLPDAPPGGRGAHPTVFVHGLLGWGAQDALYRAVPYWGLAAGDVLGYLNRCGYDCRAASVGIISSAWDRACELYAALTGGRADYGIAHAQRFGHARFGTAYPAPLVPGWGADKPVDLVGHSFGGATARLLMQLLAHGCPEEVQAAEAAGETPSPLFTGGSNLSQLRYAEAEKKGLIATYEKSIQSAFKDVADALARRETLSEELDAQRQYVAAEQTSLDIAMKSYQAGVGDYLSVLTAQRTLWSAKTTLLSLQQTDLNNRIPLWQSLGGGAS